MSYDAEKLSRVKHLKDLAQRIAADFATKKSVEDLSDRVDQLVTAGGEPNKLEAVKVNGEALPITNKAVDVGAAIAAAVSKAGHASFEKADAVPTADEAQDNVLYLVMNEETGHYDIYAKVGEEVVRLDDTTVDLTGKVDKEDGKGLSTEDFTTELKEKLAGLAVASDEEVAEMLDEVFGAEQTENE